MTDQTNDKPVPLHTRNAQIIEVPPEMYPISGYISIPLYLPPELFHKFWERVKAEKFESSYHSVLTTYLTRLPLILEANLTLFGEPVTLTDNGLDLPAQEIAAFVVAATQTLVNRATRGPNLPMPSKNGSTANSQ